MTVREFTRALATMAPDRDIFVVLFKVDGTSAPFHIDRVDANNGHTQIEINEDGCRGKPSHAPVCLKGVV